MHILDKIYCRHCSHKIGLLHSFAYLAKDGSIKPTGGRIHCGNCNEKNTFDEVVSFLQSKVIEDRLYLRAVKIYCEETVLENI